MPNDRVVRREVEHTEHSEHTIKPADTIVTPDKKVVEKHVETTETVQAQPIQPKNVNLNVNANSDPAAGDQVSVNTPDGTQVNVNP
jgi:hypothetical protein